MGYEDRGNYTPPGLGSFNLFPPVIKTLMIINVFVFFLQIMGGNLIVMGVRGDELLTAFFALNPLSGNFYIWQLITYQFMHGSFSHIFFNMLTLWMFGLEIENIWGQRKFLIFYLLCGLGGGLLQIFSPLLTQTMVTGPTIGASGAIFGVMVAFAMMFPNRYIYIYFLVPVKAKYLIVFFILLEIFSVGGMSFVAHLAHIGGALTAAAFIILDRAFGFSFQGLRRRKQASFKKSFRRPFSSNDQDSVEAKFYDINEKPKGPSQAEIDRILDKISKSGYQNLTEDEKKTLFEASNKK